jgi:4-amino-4-deoxy-L-arabinose transferase-like glycosyltransferase
MRILIGMAVIAFFVRLFVCIELSRFDPRIFTPSSATDMATYISNAHLILQGEYSKVFYYQPFYYAVFLPVIYFISAGSMWGVLIAQSLLGAATVFLAGWTGSKVFGKTSGIIGAFLLMFSSALILFTPYHLIATLQAFWVILLFYLTLISMERRKWQYWALTGFTTGLAVLTRGNAWFFVPGMLYAAVWVQFFPRRYRKPGKIFLKLLPAIVFLACLILPQIPFAWYNTAKLGKLSGPSTAAGPVLALGNTQEAPPGGREAGTGPGPMEYPPAYNFWMNTLKEKSVFGRIWDWFCEEPLAVAEINFRKLLLFWDAGEIPNNISMDSVMVRSRIFRMTGFIPTAMIIMLAVAGIIVYFKISIHSRKMLLLMYFIAAYWAATAAFYILCRFRVPVIPLLGMYAGAGFVYCYIQVKKRSRKLMFRVIPAILFGAFLTFSSYDLYRQFFEAGIMRIVRPNGVVVKLSPGKTMFLDNGPARFGGRSFITLRDGYYMDKIIPDLGEDYSKVTFEIPFGWMNSGSAVFEINGKKYTIKNDKEGLKCESFTMPFPADRKIRIKRISASAFVFPYYDEQRQYYRSKILGDNNLPGEIVCRLYLEK